MHGISHISSIEGFLLEKKILNWKFCPKFLSEISKNLWEIFFAEAFLPNFYPPKILGINM